MSVSECSFVCSQFVCQVFSCFRIFLFVKLLVLICDCLSCLFSVLKFNIYSLYVYMFVFKSHHDQIDKPETNGSSTKETRQTSRRKWCVHSFCCLFNIKWIEFWRNCTLYLCFKLRRAKRVKVSTTKILYNLMEKACVSRIVLLCNVYVNFTKIHIPILVKYKHMLTCILHNGILDIQPFSIIFVDFAVETLKLFSLFKVLTLQIFTL